MASIRKIVSTPVKWASKKILNKTLLSFPAGETNPTVACVYCPEMCRFSCPTAVASGNDTVTPCNKMGFLYKEETWPGQASQGTELWPIYDCTGCGRCTEYCKYQMPVMERLFAAREKYSWGPARQIAENLKDSEDPYGDLADELGDRKKAIQRAEKVLDNQTSLGDVWIDEPRSYFYIRKVAEDSKRDSGGIKTRWDDVFENGVPHGAISQLQGKTWYFHESVWQSRNLRQFEKVKGWVRRVEDSGVRIVLPFASGMDCKDCGGEGIYNRLFPHQAQDMAKEIWERDQDRAEGLLCMSSRCAEHFKKVLGPSVPVKSVLELYQ